MYFKDQYFFLSNFYRNPQTLVIDGKECQFTNAEAAFQAQRNPALADKFSAIKGLEAKRMADEGLIKTTIPNWDKYQLFAMANALHSKFLDSDLMSKLKNISDTEIVYMNAYGDTFWGIYHKYSKPDTGTNFLGKMLTNIRDKDNDLLSLYTYIKDELLPELGD